MRPATLPRHGGADQKMLVIDATVGAIAHARVGDLGRFAGPGDVVVVNDAATLPAVWTFSLAGVTAELRLLGVRPQPGGVLLTAVVMSSAHRSVRTEDRQPPPNLEPGVVLELAGGLLGTVLTAHDRRVRVSVQGAADRILSALYREGRAVAYAHLERELELYEVNTSFAGRPWAAEMPSAARPLTMGQIITLRRSGVSVVRITEGAGLSSTGDPELDLALPFRERAHIDEDAAHTIDHARMRGDRVIAVGTSVVRALESAARLTASGRLAVGEFETVLRVDASFERRVVSAVLTGVHEPETSHYAMLEAFASRDLLDAATRAADADDYLLHEFGDSVFVNASPPDQRPLRSLPTRSRSQDERDRRAEPTPDQRRC